MRSVIAVLLLGLLPLALSACDRQKGAKEQENAQVAATKPGEKTVRQEGGFSFAVDTSHKGEPMPGFTFQGPGGGDATLEDFRGKPLLVNLWATWCAPCVAEMPTLDALAVAHNGKLQVLVISQDSTGEDAVGPFFKAHKFTALQPYIDAENQFGFHYGSGILPTSVLYDAEGKEVARVTGAMDWRGKEASKLIAGMM